MGVSWESEGVVVRVELFPVWCSWVVVAFCGEDRFMFVCHSHLEKRRGQSEARKHGGSM